MLDRCRKSLSSDAVRPNEEIIILRASPVIGDDK